MDTALLVGLNSYFVVILDWLKRNTVVGFPETGIGLLPIAGGVSRIGHEVSRPKALEILFNSANLDVQELKNLGVVNDVF